MKQIDHPNCVQLFEVIDDEQRDELYLVMEFIDGGDLGSNPHPHPHLHPGPNPGPNPNPNPDPDPNPDPNPNPNPNPLPARRPKTEDQRPKTEDRNRTQR